IPVGEFRRKMPVIQSLDLLIVSDSAIDSLFDEGKLLLVEKQGNVAKINWAGEFKINIYHCSSKEKGSKLFRYTGPEIFLKEVVKKAPGQSFQEIPEEQSIFETLHIPFIVPELRDQPDVLDIFQKSLITNLIEERDIKGIIHCHSTYSDGLHSLEEMSRYVKSQGYEYLVISDHSKSAFYANGLQVNRLQQQWEEIDRLNEALAPFRIFKSIESDILYDGNLDYEEKILEKFDCIIASVHSQLKMTAEKATERVLKAVQNPFTAILGHPTGRLLLSREGYPLDHKAIIDACAKNGVIIELNANPWRLDLDWTWIQYALSKGVKIAINPDAHSKEGIHDVRFGVQTARKGGLTPKDCLNTLNLTDFAQFVAR
ncbi:MAG: PHP domain-containing protein, partial [Bacteroidota bacterium]